ncbi:MAG: peptidoglycan bridge formation glycyltransferase FemA/FemB family protein [Chloroflexi bacterium]|nr:peptidoglycan bridge formation glycyltransferase FemA/FemB family protein [Chloroflexota bacterium]
MSRPADAGALPTLVGHEALRLLRNDDAAWDAFVAQSETPTPLQLTAWARVKAATGWQAARVVVDGGSGPIGAQVLIRRLGPGPFALGYAPRAPIAATLDERSLAAFSAALRRFARRRRLTHVTADPGFPKGTAEGLFLAEGWRPADLVQPERTWVVDLDGTESELYGALRTTTRRYVNKARRDGCTLRTGIATDLPAFHAILVETARRGGFIHRSFDAYREIYEAFSPSGEAELLFADLPDGTPAATKLLVSCGGRVTQPYSGMTDAGAQTRANYLLEWETIRHTAAAGRAVYDMTGLPTPGIAYFKQGFGGREIQYCGSWDLVTLPLLREGIVRARRVVVSLARRRRGLAPSAARGVDIDKAGG